MPSVASVVKHRTIRAKILHLEEKKHRPKPKAMEWVVKGVSQ